MSDQSTHTPGKWMVGSPSGSLLPDSRKQYDGKPYREYDRVEAVQNLQSGELKGVAHVYQGSGGVGSPEALREQHANTRLISAAPDMLEALKDARYIYTCMPPVELNIITGVDPLTVKEISLAIKAAIAKAEGGRES